MTSAPDMHCARLPLRFDVDKLVAAYRLTRACYEPAIHLAGHDGRSYHDGWTGVSLRANGGRWRDAGPGGPSPEPFRDTEIVERIPFWKEVLGAFRCVTESVRVSVLGARGTIVPHRDEHVGFSSGRLRLHVPILTSDDVVMEIEGQRCCWQPGELWYGDFGQVHSVTNRGDSERVHLVIDAQLNDWLLGLLPPELLVGQRIARFPEPHPLGAQDLAHCRCSFTIPAGSAQLFSSALLPAMRETLATERAELVAQVVVSGDTLTLALNGKPAFALEPLPQDRFRLCGWPLRFELRLDRGASGIAAVAFTDGDRWMTWEAHHGI